MRKAIVFAAAFACALASTAVAAPSDVLVTADWVWQNKDKAGIRLVEVSVDPGVYEQGHVPGAVGLRWHSELVDPVRRDIVSAENFAALASRAGISPGDTVILYGDNNNWFAAWAYWIFDLYGHADVRLMDGGRKKWEADKRPMDTAVPAPAATRYPVPKATPATRARLADVLAVVEGKTAATLVDVRSADEYAGKIFAPPGVQELAIRAGHIPGAKNIPWAKAVNEDGTFKSADELRALYAAAGVDGKQPVITYCRIGERSSHSWFVLSQLLGYKVANYDGSSTEWNNTVGVPIENPSGTVWGKK